MRGFLVAAPTCGLLIASALAARALGAQAPRESGPIAITPSSAATYAAVGWRLLTPVDSPSTRSADANVDATVFPVVPSFASALASARGHEEWPHRERTFAEPSADGDENAVDAAATIDEASETWPYRVASFPAGDDASAMGAAAASAAIGGVRYYHRYWYHRRWWYAGCCCGWAYYRYPRWSPFAARYSLGFASPWSAAAEMAVR